MFRLLSVASLLTLSLPTAHAIIFRSYNATDHKRLDPFPAYPATPTINPNQLYAALDLTGIGWQSNSPDIQYTLVSRQHVVFATHFADVLGTANIRFVNASGGYVSRTGPTLTIIQDSGQDSDLTIIRLNSPINASTGIEPLAYLDLPDGPNPFNPYTNYEGLEIGVAGKRNENGNKFPVIGKGTVADVENSSRADVDYDNGPGTEFLNTRYLRFDYSVFGSDDDEVYFESGDSGSPSFVSTGGKAALVGVHSSIAVTNGGTVAENFDVFIPHYIAELDAILATDGYRMRPVNAPATTLTDASATVQPTPRRALPLDFSYTLTNTGANDTGNLEVEFHFDPSEAPDSLAPPTGWVTYGSGPSWIFRRAVLADGADATFDATWATAPSVGEVDPGIVRRSDTVAEVAPSITITLAPSFADWATGLAEAGEDDDPDKDTLINLLEYAFGGDPESGHLLFEDDGPLTPDLGVAGGTVTLSFPERDDKALRGLSYIPEFSSTLGGWVTTTPPGFSSTIEAYAPAVPGFVKRLLTWTATSGPEFARIRVDLNE